MYHYFSASPQMYWVCGKKMKSVVWKIQYAVMFYCFGVFLFYNIQFNFTNTIHIRRLHISLKNKPHLENSVDSYNWRFIIYGCYIDINHKWQTLLPDICIIGHHCKIISHGLTSIMDIEYESLFSLWQKKEYNYFLQTTFIIKTTSEYYPFIMIIHM